MIRARIALKLSATNENYLFVLNGSEVCKLAKDKHQNLVKLGAEKLATALLDLANYNDSAYAVVERLLESPKESAKSYSKRLSSFKRRRHFISWGESGAYARELVDMLKALEDSSPDPKVGVSSVASFYDADVEIFDKCDDSSGRVGEVFKVDAADLFVSFASRCDEKEWLVDLVISLNQIDGYGVRDVLFERMSQFLPESFMRLAVDRLWERWSSDSDKWNSRHWLFALADLAKQLRDPLLLERVERAESKGELTAASKLDLAKLQYECGDLHAALAWIDQVPLKEYPMARERDELLIKIYTGLNKKRKLRETASRVFRRDRDVESLEVLLSVVGEDKRTELVDAQAKSIFKSVEFDPDDAYFLVEIGRIDDVEMYIIAHSQRVNGDYYSRLLELAKAMLKYDRLAAACIIYRALIDSILARAKAKNYHHAVNYLKKLDSLSNKIRDWKGVETHSIYVENLRQKHKYKSSFWSQYSPKS